MRNEFGLIGKTLRTGYFESSIVLFLDSFLTAPPHPFRQQNDDSNISSIGI